MQLLLIVIIRLVSIELEVKHFQMILQVVMENLLIRSLDIFMVRIKINDKLKYFAYLGSSYVASPDGSRTPVSY
jgi:hypothetical protein